MKMRSNVACVLAAAGLAAPALAQDSVAQTDGLPGDAVYPWDTAEQSNNYVVDLTPFTSSWGNEFATGPLSKLSRSPNNETFFTHGQSASGLSRLAQSGVAFPSDTYAVWTTPGQGINNSINTAPDSVDAPASGVQLGFLNQEFDTATTGIDSNIVVSGFVNYEPSNPLRLYVTRVFAAHSGQDPDQGFGDNSTFGAGSVDSNGNVAFRADDFGPGGDDVIIGNNWYRVDTSARDVSMINEIRQAGPQDAGATDWVLVNSGTTHTTPSMIPEELAGRNVLLGTNFDDEFAFESAVNTISTTQDHLQDYTDAVANVGFFPINPFTQDAVGTAAIFGFDSAEIWEDDTDSLLIWSVDGDGNFVEGIRVPLPDDIIDNDQPSYNLLANPNVPSGGDAQGPQFILGNWQSQVPFRGGNGQVAMGYDQDGDLLVASQLFIGSASVTDVVDGALFDNTPQNAIAVARFPDGDVTAEPEWTLAGWCEGITLGLGKFVKDGPGGDPIGQLIDLAIATGGAVLGPSMSSPMMDAAGNLYFLSGIQFFEGDDPFDTALIRAVYNPDTFSYELELLFSLGFVFDGQNSGTPYQIQFLPLVDSNSIGSGAPTSNNITSNAIGNVDLASEIALDPADPRTLGGLIVAADIVYDVDGDGDFEDPTSNACDCPESGDESYNVLMWVGPAEGIEEEECLADCNDDGVLNILDFTCFQAAFQAGDLATADCDGSGSLNILDFTCFQAAFQAGCP